MPFFHSKVNPADCVDMVCDAKRKSFLRDMDGSFLGNSGSVIPQAEYEWNGNSQFGIGDYRIPEVMLTFPNGSRIPVTEKAPHKGSLDILLLVLKFVKQHLSFIFSNWGNQPITYFLLTNLTEKKKYMDVFAEIAFPH